MRKMFILPMLIVTAALSFPLYADDDPQDDIGAQKLDNMECVDESTQNCINDACLNSDEIDCEQNCKKMSQEKCQQQQDE